MSVNWDEVHKLLSISDLAHQWPALSQLNHAAMRALQGHADIAKKDNDEAAKKKADEEAAVAAKRAEEVKKEEADRLKQEEERAKSAPKPKTPAEAAADDGAAKAAEAAAQANARLGDPAPQRALSAEPQADQPFRRQETFNE